MMLKDDSFKFDDKKFQNQNYLTESTTFFDQQEKTLKIPNFECGSPFDFDDRNWILLKEDYLQMLQGPFSDKASNKVPLTNENFSSSDESEFNES